MDHLADQLVLHGSVSLLAGFLSGAPMGSAINRGAGEASVRAWRVAHTGLVMGGLLLLAIAAILPRVAGAGRLSEAAVWVLVVAFVVSVYGFLVALPLGAYTGNRGLQPRPSTGARRQSNRVPRQHGWCLWCACWRRGAVLGRAARGILVSERVGRNNLW